MIFCIFRFFRAPFLPLPLRLRAKSASRRADFALAPLGPCGELPRPPSGGEAWKANHFLLLLSVLLFFSPCSFSLLPSLSSSFPHPSSPTLSPSLSVYLLHLHYFSFFLLPPPSFSFPSLLPPFLMRKIIRKILRQLLRQILRHILRQVLRQILRQILRQTLRQILRQFLRQILRQILRQLLRQILRQIL